MAKIRIGNDPVLKQVCTDFLPGERSEWIEDLIKTCKKSKTAVGLAAPQIGITKRVFYLYCRDEKGNIKGEVVINPVILSESPEKTVEQEGCMSYPGIYKDIERPREIVARYETWPTRQVVERTIVDYKCRVFCHEFDHLNGECLIGGDSASSTGKVMGESGTKKKSASPALIAAILGCASMNI